MTRRLVALSLLLAAASWAAPKKVSPDLKNLEQMPSVNVIVQWKSSPDDNKHRKVIELGGVLQKVHSLINASAYTVPGSVINLLASDPDVAYITPDRPLEAKLDLTAAAVNASYAWNLAVRAVGTGIGVAVIDSGITPND